MEKITAETLKALIAQRYEAQSNAGKYAVFFELRSRTGGAAGSIDAFVMNTWPSSKFHRYAFEIKVSRGDLMHELDHPEKRKWAYDISNEFWFVCAPGIAKPDEIPETCGLMVATKNGKQLRTQKRAQYREAEPLEVWEIASIIRSASRMQNFPHTLIWKYSGQELTDAELDVVIQERRSYMDEDDINKRARIMAKEMFDKQNIDMAKYAMVMQNAGIEPPGFMTGKSGEAWEHTIKDWVDRHFITGPDNKQIRRVVQDLKSIGLTVKAAQDNIAQIAKKNKPDDGQETIPN